eukprot:SAG31_NODE_8_length_42345_cov_10.980992_20_plen_77_part_00
MSTIFPIPAAARPSDARIARMPDKKRKMCMMRSTRSARSIVVFDMIPEYWKRCSMMYVTYAVPITKRSSRFQALLM